MYWDLLPWRRCKKRVQLKPWVKFKHVWSYTSTPPYVLLKCHLIKHEDNFTFTFFVQQMFKSVKSLKFVFLTNLRVHTIAVTDLRHKILACVSLIAFRTGKSIYIYKREVKLFFKVHICRKTWNIIFLVCSRQLPTFVCSKESNVVFYLLSHS